MAKGPRTDLSRRVDLSLVVDVDHYDVLVQKVMREARVSLWIATANVKEMRVEAPLGSVARAKGRYVSILETFEELLARGVEIRFLHAGVPSRAFRAELERRRGLARKLTMRQCPRVHLKMIAVDGSELYLGSANFTGAGLGAKGEGRRNFEIGMLTHDDVLLDVAQARFDRIWSGRECGKCKLRSVCPRPLDLPAPGGAPGALAPGGGRSRAAPPPPPRLKSALTAGDAAGPLAPGGGRSRAAPPPPPRLKKAPSSPIASKPGKKPGGPGGGV